MRAVALPEVPKPTWAVVLDMPMSTAIEQRIQQETGIRLGEVTAHPGARRAAGDRPPDRRPARRRRRRPGAVAAAGALGGVPRSRRLGHRRARKRVGRHPDQHVGDLRPHLGGVADRPRPDELRPVAAARAGAGRRAVPDHPVRRAGDRLRAGAADHRRRARPVHRHAARARRQLRPPDSRARARSARRARRVVQPDDRRSDDAARRDGGEGPPRAGNVRGARNPAEAAADRPAAA